MGHKRGRDCYPPKSFKPGQPSWSCPECGNTFRMTPADEVDWSGAGGAGHVRKADGRKAGLWDWLFS
jgi:hypothetical protein